MKHKMTSGAVGKYINYLEREEKSKATVEKYRRDISRFYAFLPGRKRFEKQQVLQYKEYLMKYYARSSVNSMLAALNSFFSYMGWDDYRVKQLRVQKRVFCPEESVLTKKEYQQLLETARRQKNERLYYVMLTLCGTGIRISELPYITVQSLRQGRIQVTGKNKSRDILVPLRLKRLLLEYSRKKGIAKGPVFVTKTGKELDRSNIWSEMKKIAHDAKVLPEKVYPHSLRHLFARHFYEQEKDIVKLADILGHCSIDTTRIYTISTGRQHEKHMEAMGLII